MNSILVYCSKFAKNIASDDGLLFTSKSLVKINVNTIEPKSDILLDDAVSGAEAVRHPSGKSPGAP